MNYRKLASIVLLVAPAWTTSAYAGGAAENFSSVVGHSGMAVGHSVVGSVSAVASIAALPLAVVGSVGTVSTQASNELWEIGNAPIGDPLPIAEETITVGPSPRKALIEQGDAK